MNNMKQMIANVIRYNTMPMANIYERIETMYINNSLTAEERADLIEMMHSHATPEAELGDWKAMYEAIAVRVNALAARIEELEKKMAPESGEPDEGGEDDNTEQYNEWVAWDGVNGGYQLNEKVMHNGYVWQSTMNGLNVWEPGAPGIDERYWIMVANYPAADDAV